MRRVLAAGGCALVLAACGSSIGVDVGSPSPSDSSAESPAASLRVHMDLLLGEHVFVVAKLAVAAAAGRSDEYRSYAGVLAQNGGDVEALFRTALGQSAGGQFGEAWAEQNNELVDYVVAAVTHDDAGASVAMGKLTATVPDLVAALGSGLTISKEQSTQLAGDYVTALIAIVDDAATANYARLYVSITGARKQGDAFGGALALEVAHQFPDRFPGDLTTKAATFRDSLNSLMQQQGYLMTMATSATVTRADAGAAAAAAALQPASNELAILYGGDVWLNEAELTTTYAKSGDPSARQSVLGAAPPNLNQAFTALLQVVDDQRNKSYTNLAGDDRAMATALAGAADEISFSPSS